ncbi:hypothetical protein BC567DRAFT_57685 [Phyllosticta citribraziliensis]
MSPLRMSSISPSMQDSPLDVYITLELPMTPKSQPLSADSKSKSLKPEIPSKLSAPGRSVSPSSNHSENPLENPMNALTKTAAGPSDPTPTADLEGAIQSLGPGKMVSSTALDLLLSSFCPDSVRVLTPSFLSSEWSRSSAPPLRLDPHCTCCLASQHRRHPLGGCGCIP